MKSTVKMVNERQYSPDCTEEMIGSMIVRAYWPLSCIYSRMKLNEAVMTLHTYLDIVSKLLYFASWVIVYANLLLHRLNLNYVAPGCPEVPIRT